MHQAHNAGARLERIPFFQFHWRNLAAVGTAMFFDGYNLYLSGLVLPELRANGWVNTQTSAAFISLPLVGAALGALIAGILGDRFGRRGLLIYNILIISAGAIASFLAPNLISLVVMRTIVGLSLGMVISTGYSYVNEIVPGKVRGTAQSGMAFLVNSGLPIAGLLAAFILPSFSPALGWRLLYLISVIVFPIALLGRQVLPESPRWLEAVGRNECAGRVVADIENYYVRCKGVRTLPEPLESAASFHDTSWGALFRKPIRSRFLLAIFLSVCHFTGVYVFVSWLPTLMASRGMSASGSVAFSAVVFSGGFLGPLISMAIADRFERRWIIAWTSAVAAACGVIFSITSNADLLICLGFALLCSVNLISSILLATYIPEIMPTSVRLRGVGTAFLFGRLVAALSPFVVSALLPQVSNPLLIVSSVGGFYFLMAVAIVLFGPNTFGKSLESLESSVHPAEQS